MVVSNGDNRGNLDLNLNINPIHTNGLAMMRDEICEIAAADDNSNSQNCNCNWQCHLDVHIIVTSNDNWERVPNNLSLQIGTA